jgi:hypothetical protein
LLWERGGRTANPKISNAPYLVEMKDDDALPTTTANTKKESSDLSLFGEGWYKYWELAAILIQVHQHHPALLVRW